MSEFDKLMAKGTSRKAIKQRITDKQIAWRNWRWIMLAAFVLTLIPPHALGIMLAFPAIVWGVIMGLVEWSG